MPDTQPPEVHLRAVRYALEEEVAHRVPRSWWDESLRAQVFEIAAEDVVHHVAIDATFFADCPDYAMGLRESELADYLRETRETRQLFHVVWQGGTVRLRLKRR